MVFTMFKLPKFKRQNAKAKKRVKSGWRKPRGIDNKLREKKKGFGFMPSVGYRKSRKVRNTRNGVLLGVARNVKDLEFFKGGSVFIGKSVGRRKRSVLIKKARELGVKVLNE